MGDRRKGREYALQLLYQKELAHGKAPILEEYWKEVNPPDTAKDFAELLFEGVCKYLPQLDELLTSHSTNWKLSRMAAIDKSILRIALFELLYCPDIPARVTLNEAVEIAKRFGTEESGAFVNGILDSVAQEVARKKGEKNG